VARIRAYLFTRQQPVAWPRLRSGGRRVAL